MRHGASVRCHGERVVIGGPRLAPTCRAGVVLLGQGSVARIVLEPFAQRTMSCALPAPLSSNPMRPLPAVGVAAMLVMVSSR